jgi:hypothetical protein
MSIFRWKNQFCFLALFALILGACSGISIPGQAERDSQVATAAIQTYQAQSTADANQLPAATATSAPVDTATIPPTATLTLEPTVTPTLEPSPTATPDPSWAGNWTMLVLMMSGQPFPATFELNGHRMTSTIFLQGVVYPMFGDLSADHRQISGGVNSQGQLVAYFIWQMLPNTNQFIGRWWKGGDQVGSMCGARRGAALPAQDECLLRP